MGQMSLGEFWERVVILCHLYDARVTSGPRSTYWNKKVGGVPDSFHLVGLAADLVCRNPEHRPLLTHQAGRLGIRVITEEDHDHLQPK